jgi:hypothetical protein
MNTESPTCRHQCGDRDHAEHPSQDRDECTRKQGIVHEVET